MEERDRYWLQQALRLARRAAEENEVPVGAVLIGKDEVLLGEGYNRPVATRDPTAHAEIAALRRAAVRADNYRLLGCTLYVTLEPCPMCAGALVHARISRIVFGAHDPRAGACGTVFNLVQSPRLNHRILVEGGLLEQECSELLKTFFRVRRKNFFNAISPDELLGRY